MGEISGALLGQQIPARGKETLPLIFGVTIIGIGMILVRKASYLHVVVLALILGALLGELLYLERILGFMIRKTIQWSSKHGGTVDDGFIVHYVTLISAVCFGSMEIFGAIDEGIAGNPSIFFTKAVLGLASGVIFGASLGGRISLVAIPQFLVLVVLYLSANFFMPFMSPTMLNDFLPAAA